MTKSNLLGLPLAALMTTLPSSPAQAANYSSCETLAMIAINTRMEGGLYKAGQDHIDSVAQKMQTGCRQNAASESARLKQEIQKYREAKTSDIYRNTNLLMCNSLVSKTSSLIYPNRNQADTNKVKAARCTINMQDSLSPAEGIFETLREGDDLTKKEKEAFEHWNRYQQAVLLAAQAHVCGQLSNLLEQTDPTPFDVVEKAMRTPSVVARSQSKKPSLSFKEACGLNPDKATELLLKKLGLTGKENADKSKQASRASGADESPQFGFKMAPLRPAQTYYDLPRQSLGFGGKAD